MALAAAVVATSELAAQATQAAPVPQPPGIAAATAAGPNRTYEAVVQGMSCKQRPSGRMDCEYQVGKSLRFTIAGVGQQDVVINFLKVDGEEDYVASVAPLHGCVVVRPVAVRTDTSSNLAFVSSHDGKIYRNWNPCLRPKK